MRFPLHLGGAVVASSCNLRIVVPPGCFIAAAAELFHPFVIVITSLSLWKSYLYYYQVFSPVRGDTVPWGICKNYSDSKMCKLCIEKPCRELLVVSKRENKTVLTYRSNGYGLPCTTVFGIVPKKTITGSDGSSAGCGA